MKIWNTPGKFSRKLTNVLTLSANLTIADELFECV